MNRFGLIAIALMFSFTAPPAMAEGSWFGVLITDHTTERGDKAVKILAIHPLGPLAGVLKTGALVFKLGGSRTETVAQFVATANKIDPDSQIILDVRVSGNAKRGSALVKTVGKPKVFTAPAVCPSDKKDPPKTVMFYAIHPPKGSNTNPIDAELSWLRASTGCSVRDDVEVGFRKIYKIALDHKVDYPDLVQHSVDSAKEEKPKRSAAKGKPATSAANGNPQSNFFTESDCDVSKGYPKSGNPDRVIKACTWMIKKGLHVSARDSSGRRRTIGDLVDEGIKQLNRLVPAYFQRAMTYKGIREYGNALADFKEILHLQASNKMDIIPTETINLEIRELRETMAASDVGRKKKRGTGTKKEPAKKPAVAKKEPAKKAAENNAHSDQPFDSAHPFSGIEILLNRMEEEYVSAYKALVAKSKRMGKHEELSQYNNACAELLKPLIYDHTGSPTLPKEPNKYIHLNKKIEILLREKSIDPIAHKELVDFIRLVGAYCIGKFISEGDDFLAYTLARVSLVTQPKNHAALLYILYRHYLDISYPGSDGYVVEKIVKLIYHGKVPETKSVSSILDKRISRLSRFLKKRHVASSQANTEQGIGERKAEKRTGPAKKKPSKAAALDPVEKYSAVLKKRYEKQYVDSYKTFLQTYVRPDNVELVNSLCYLNTTMTGILTDKYISEKPGAAYVIINQTYKIDRESKILLKDDTTMRVFFKYCLGKFISEGDDFKSYAVARQMLIYRPLDMMHYVLARHVLDVRFVGSDLFAVNKIIKPYFNGKIPEPSDKFKKHIFYTAKFLVVRAKTNANQTKVEAPPKKPVKKDAAAKTCEGGNATDCYEEGNMYSLGESSTDKMKALKLFRKACEGGISRACHDVGSMFYNGEGGAANKQEARIFYQKACDGGDAHGCYNIGQMHDKGEGGSADKPKALKFFRKACEGRFLEGCYNAAFMLGSGEGSPVDKSQARKLYRTACEGGHTMSCLFGETMKTGVGKEPEIQ